MVITFAGHSIILSADKVKEKVKECIKNNLSEEKLLFYLGGYGDFDEICASVCREIKKEYKNVELVYITPYLNINEQEKIRQNISDGLYDSTIYPPIETVPLRFSILKRNEWMVKNADIVIAYIDHNYGGAYKTVLYAKKEKKKIINIYDYL